MKKLIFPLLSSLLFFIPNLSAQINVEDLGSQNIVPSIEKEERGRPIQISLSADFVSQAHFKKCHDLHHLTFSTGLAEAGFVYYYNPCHHEGANIALAYELTRLDWKYNPFFNEKDIHSISVWLGAFTKRLCNWLWKAQVSINFDNVEHWCFQDYMNYDLVLWGRYDYCENIGINIGFIGQTGMKIDRVYPIIGIDWQYSSSWKFNLIFPVNISVVYTINPSWSVALAGRYFDQRHRVKSREFLSKALWHYETGGAELALNYTPTKWISANVHVGADFGGHITVANRHYRHRRRLRLEGAPYAGAEIDMSF